MPVSPAARWVVAGQLPVKRLFPALALALAGFLVVPVPIFSQSLRVTVGASSPAILTGQVLAEILDPSLGQRWELTTDPRHPAGPWRLILAESRVPVPGPILSTRGEAIPGVSPVANLLAPTVPDQAGLKPAAPITRQLLSTQPEIGTRGESLAGGLAGLSSVSQQVVIRAGDRVIVEQRTPVLTAYFGAVAMEQAMAGRPFRVRLNTEQSSPGWTGGTVIQVIAVAQGQASWSSLVPDQPAPATEPASPAEPAQQVTAQQVSPAASSPAESPRGAAQP